jgi:hypothetical protein
VSADLFLRGFFHHAVGHGACVVDGDVQWEGDQLTGIFRGQFLHGFDVAGCGDDAVAAGQSGLGEGPAEAAGGGRMSDKKGPDHSRRKERSRQAVLKAARDLVMEEAYEKVTVEAIAIRAGVG